MIVVSFLQHIGARFLAVSNYIGSFIIFATHAIIGIMRPPYEIKNIKTQFLTIGFYSLPVVGMTALFSGAVLALQSYSGFARFSAESSVATVVVLSITRELGPVLAGLMVAGRVGASIAAEIGTMRVTEQIDALYTLSTDPIKYLVSPRVLAAAVTLPCLVLIGDIIGVMGGYIVSVKKLDFNSAYYIINTFKYLEKIDVISGLVKAFVFGLIIATVSCYCGYNSGKGAKRGR
jgi:phospholipid/cholesterol/gamma-HCH transport system permease protein